MFVKLNLNKFKFNINNHKSLSFIPLSTIPSKNEICQFIIAYQCWIIPVLMVFLLYKIYKSRDPFTKIIIEDFPSIESRENALNLFNKVYGFIFTFCVFIIMIDLFDLNSYFALIYNGESVNIRFLTPVKWLLALLLKIVLTYITYRSYGWKSFRFIISVFSLLLLIGIPIIYSSEFLTIYLKDGIISMTILLIVGISYISDLNSIPLPMDGINKSSWKSILDKYTLKMNGIPGNNQYDPRDNLPGTDPENKRWDRRANYTTKDDTLMRADITKFDLKDHLRWVHSKLDSNVAIPPLDANERRLAWPTQGEFNNNEVIPSRPGLLSEKIIAARYERYWVSEGLTASSPWNPMRIVEQQRALKELSAWECFKAKIDTEDEIKHILQTLDGTRAWNYHLYDYRYDLRKKVEILKANVKILEIRTQELNNNM